MRITCCCFTCIIGEDEKDSQEENDRLIKGDDKDSSSQDQINSRITEQPSYSRSVSAVSSSSTYRGFSTESQDPLSESTEGGTSNNSKEKFSKAVGVLKKYNVMSAKYNTKELQRQLSSPVKLRLKIGIKVLQRSNLAKVSVIEAHGVLEMLQTKEFLDMISSTESESSAPVVQVRTKLLHSEVRGHTRKYEIQGGVTGALKLKNETIHTVDLEEFRQCKLRFRLYYVLKHQRDKLLGEYMLDATALNLDASTNITHFVFEMYDPATADPHATPKPPESVPVTQRMLSTTDSQASIDASGSVTPKIQRQPKIRSQESEILRHDVEKVSFEEVQGERSEDDVHSPKSPFTKAFKSIRHGASHVLKESGSRERDSKSISSDSEPSLPPAEQLTASEKLKLALKERGEKVSELEDVTAEMAGAASNFGALSVKLKEKYKGESKKKHHKSSD